MIAGALAFLAVIGAPIIAGAIVEAIERAIVRGAQRRREGR